MLDFLDVCGPSQQLHTLCASKKWVKIEGWFLKKGIPEKIQFSNSVFQSQEN